MIKVGISGAAGRMGQIIIRLLAKEKNMKLAAAIEARNHPMLGKDAGECAGTDRTGVVISSGTKNPGKIDVLIDFSSPQAAVEHMKQMAERKIPVVIGTTGLSPAQLQKIRRFSRKIPCVMAPNMSVGVNLMFKLLKLAGRILGKKYDVEIVEAHHRFKKDAPSGTAKRMAEIIAEEAGLDLAKSGVYGRKGITGARKKGELGIMSVRAGDIIGDHTVMFAGAGERLELTHRALSRDTFARGAILAAMFAVRAKKGLHDMQDVLGVK